MGSGIPVVGSFLGGGKPKAPNLPPPAPPPPTEVDPGVIAARQRQRRQAASALGGSVKTSSQGLTGQAETTKKTLLGS